ncbi:MAG: ABC transporter ATP-binding protein [Actinomycetota bacterium]
MTTTARPDRPPASTMDAAALLRLLFADRRRHVVVGAVAGVLWTGGTALTSIVVGQTINAAIDGAGAARISLWILAIFGAIGASALGGVVRHRAATLLSVDGSRLAERQLSDRVLDRRGGVEAPAGRLTSLATGDADKTSQALVIATQTAGGVLTLIGVAIWLLSASLSLGLLVLVAVPATMGVIFPLLARYSERAADERKELAEATASAADGIEGLRAAHGLGGEPVIQRWFRSRSARMHGSALALVRFEARLFAVGGFVPWLTLVPVLWVGGGQTIDGTIQAGTFVTVVALAQFISNPVMILGETLRIFASSRSSARRITEVVQRPFVVAETSPRTRPTGPVAATGNGARAAIEVDRLTGAGIGPLSFTVGEGETVGITCVDDRQAGSVAALLGRRAEVTGGSIHSGGVDLSSVALADRPRHLAVVDTERPWLLSASLLDNLRLGGGPVSETAARSALWAAGADDLLRRAEVLDRPLGERGLRLSGGQRQRVAIAQALLMATEALVLIEPTSALDAITEAVVVERLRDTARPPTVIITTSAPVLASCARVVVIADGVVRATGTHPELVATVPAYGALVGTGS